MKGVNKAIVIGTLGKDPEMRYMSSGGAVASISVATSEAWKDKNTGEAKEKTEWHNVTAFGRLAEIMGEYLKKGSQVYIEGKLQTDKWQDKQGNDRYTTKIYASQMQMLGGRQQQQNGGTTSNPDPVAAGSPNAAGLDDDIPFIKVDYLP